VRLTDRFTLGSPQIRGFDIRCVGPRVVTRPYALDPSNGAPIPNVYLAAQDFSGSNGDYNDNLLVIEGVTPVSTAPVHSLLQLMELKLLAKRCGFSRIKPEKPNIVLETPMEEPAFRLLRQGLPQHLHGRLVYQGGAGSTAKVVARGLGVLPAEKQLEQLKEWLGAMAEQIPGTDGLSDSQREEQQKARNAAVLVV